MFFKNEKLTSFEVITLHLSGMRFICEYEIVMKDNLAEISEYGIRYHEGEDERILRRRTTCEESEVIKLLNDCKFMSWDGFYGSHPKGVLDGTMFHLDAIVNGDKKIHASGSENFPKHFRELEDWFYQVLKDAEEIEEQEYK